jgi:hypothetical protein
MNTGCKPFVQCWLNKSNDYRDSQLLRRTVIQERVFESSLNYKKSISEFADIETSTDLKYHPG